jgi:AraC family transcriptional regulator
LLLSTYVGAVLCGPLPPSERVLYESDIVVVGQVRCRPDVPHFRDCGSARISARTFLWQRQIFEHVRRTVAPDTVLVDERCLRLLAAIVSEAHGGIEGSPVDGRDYELVETTRRAIDERFAGSLSLAAVANEVGTSPFHLCRAFRRVAGTSIHRYLTSVRLRRAVECLGRDEVDLGDLAIQLGFNSHSHFSAAFRREFRITPSICRGRFGTAHLC